ncbi:hypothetical protein CGCF413_v003704 [Colletotrichum fructicola]|nr:hypothetical protein CGCF413_v003704 [Colletotrichum fructicola]
MLSFTVEQIDYNYCQASRLINSARSHERISISVNHSGKALNAYRTNAICVVLSVIPHTTSSTCRHYCTSKFVRSSMQWGSSGHLNANIRYCRRAYRARRAALGDFGIESLIQIALG